jgi:rhodanese-related sulfurtransferase
MNASLLRLFGLTLLLACIGSAWAGKAELRDPSDLAKLMIASPQCCVIDARTEQRREKQPIPGTIGYRKDLQLQPSSVMLVVADDDRRALEVARELARIGPHDALAVKGGVAGWQSLDRQLQAEAAKPGSTYSFVIPHDTCQQAEPLHVFPAKKAAPQMSTPAKP